MVVYFLRSVFTKNFGSRQSLYDNCLHYLRKGFKLPPLVVQVDYYACKRPITTIYEVKIFLQQFEVHSLEADNLEIMGAKLTQLPYSSITIVAKDNLSALNPTTASASPKGERTATEARSQITNPWFQGFCILEG